MSYNNPFLHMHFRKELPKYQTKLDEINKCGDEVIKNIYAKFSFEYFNFDEQADRQSNSKKISSDIFLQLKNSKFITYYFVSSSELKTKNESSIQSNLNLQVKMNYIFCFEKKCIIIENADTSSIDNIINQLKQLKISIINTNTGVDVNEEIAKFCTFFKKIIKSNDFIEYTIKPISGYLIRRFYYPSNYFNDSSFFKFDQASTEDEKQLKEIIDKNLFPGLIFGFPKIAPENFVKEVKKCEKSNKEREYYNFKEKDFIILRTIHAKTDTFCFYYLAIHLQSLHLFLLKKFMNPDKITKEMDCEMKFCRYSHRCLTRFYGFVKEGDGKIIGLVYEFMSNGSLESYINRDKDVDESYLIMTIFRIYSGLNFLYKNKLIHRDLKPSNILIDHNKFAYISDFETIRNLETNDSQFTTDIGSSAYASPEQDKGENLSYSTDIYSFGLIIYFLFEKTDLCTKISDKEKPIKPMKNGPYIIRKLYESCVKYQPEERIKNDEIMHVLNDELNIFIYLEVYLLASIVNVCKPKIINLYFERFLNEQTEKGMLSFFQSNIKSVKHLLLLNEKKQMPELCLHLGHFYLEGLGVKRDFLRAFEYYRKSAKFNNYNALNILSVMNSKCQCLKHYDEQQTELINSDALFILGFIYSEGLGVGRDYLKGVKYYEQSAEFNNSNALLNLGYFYSEGRGVKQDYLKAIEYFEKSAQLNNSDALYRLGRIYYEGIGVKKNYSKSIEYYEKSAQLNNSNAFCSLGLIYLYSLYVKRDYLKAIEYFEKSAESNNSNALFYLGFIYSKGIGVEQNYLKAFEYFSKSAQLNNSEALFNLGYLFNEGVGVSQNYLKAIEYYEKAAKLNNSKALFNLGHIYFNGKGVERNYLKAIEYFELAAKLNNSDALTNLGKVYHDGLGVERDYLKAIEYYRKAGQLNNSNALQMLGCIFIEGDGIKKDYLKAIDYFEKSARLNNSFSLICLGNIYLDGVGVKQNYAKAVNYYERSAQLNNSQALFNLGNLYFSGRGVKQNYAKAIDYYERSAQLDNPMALVSLGSLYFEGLGVAQNYLKAIEYFEKAAKFNDSYAFFLLGDLYSNDDEIQVDLDKAISNFLKSIDIQNGYQPIFEKFSQNKARVYKTNNCRYFSYNDVGLIYLLDLNEKQKAVDCIKESAFAEYPFGQNNFGLLNEFYLNEIANAEYMYVRSSSHKFPLAEYNLGHLKEKKNGEMSIDSVEYYVRASDHEEEPLIFRGIARHDTRLLVSKMFIICLANLKLTEYYWAKGDYNESKKYFIRSFDRIIQISYNFSYQFNFLIKNEDVTNENYSHCFSYLKKFILNTPLFNLKSQPNLKLDHYLDDPHCETATNSTKEYSKLNNWFENDQNVNRINCSLLAGIDASKGKFINEKFMQHKKHDLNNIIFESPIELFEFVISNSNLQIQTIFIDEIKEIIKMMDEILYTPPYSILFGRISITKPIKKEKDLRKVINNHFYEGFSIPN